jgi:hypothetical protein
MTTPQSEILRYFRRYDVEAGQMLFFDTGPASTNPGRFKDAMGGLIRDGLVVQERPSGAYSLTEQGYRIAQTIS